MHPHFQQQLAQQRMEELRREAMRYSYNAEVDTLTQSNTRARMLYLLLGLRVPAYRQDEKQDFVLSSLQERFRATMRMVCALSLALGLLIGSLLNGEFGVIPAAVLSGVVFVVVAAPIARRSVGVLRAYGVRRS